jgi:hypothetical protein
MSLPGPQCMRVSLTAGFSRLQRAERNGSEGQACASPETRIPANRDNRRGFVS